MTSSSGLTERTERRQWITMSEHMAALARLVDDGYTDKVTHCHNWQYLLEILEPQIEASCKYGFPLSLVLAEIAHFRQIRFTFGDSLSNKILEETARVIKSRVRSTDLLVRSGDDSFGLLLLHANRLGSEIVCRRLKELISRHAFTGRGSDTMITMTFGAAEQLAGNSSDGKDLLASAAKALEKANHVGPGAIVVSGINL